MLVGVLRIPCLLTGVAHGWARYDIRVKFLMKEFTLSFYRYGSCSPFSIHFLVKKGAGILEEWSGCCFRMSSCDDTGEEFFCNFNVV